MSFLGKKYLLLLDMNGTVVRRERIRARVADSTKVCA